MFQVEETIRRRKCELLHPTPWNLHPTIIIPFDRHFDEQSCDTTLKRRFAEEGVQSAMGLRKLPISSPA